jgi:cell division protein ZapA (FtsZ GTPase activity inhibitor)
MNWKQKITIDIAGRPYQFQIENEEDEERIRKAGKLIAEKLNQSKQHYKDKYVDVQDLLAVTALLFAIKTVELETKVGSTEQVNKLKQICEQIDAFLDKCAES